MIAHNPEFDHGFLTRRLLHGTARAVMALLFLGGGNGTATEPSSPDVTAHHPPETEMSGNAQLTEPVPEGPRALQSFRLAGTALKPRNSNATYVPTAGGGCFYSTASSYTSFNAPLTLPQGSWIDSVRVYYNDTSSIDSAAWFTIYDLYGNIVQEWLVSSSGATGNGFNDTALINHTIDYSVYSYMLNWRPNVLGAEMQLCGFRVFYTPY